MLEELGIDYEYTDCKENEIRVINYKESKIFDVDYFLGVLQGNKITDLDNLLFWNTLIQ
jgi:hypothetical protein